MLDRKGMARLWPVAELVEDEFAERCRLCQFAADELERQFPEDESPEGCPAPVDREALAPGARPIP